MERTQFEYEIKQHIATLTEDEGAEYQKQLNIVSWKGAKPSLDLRLWRMTKEGGAAFEGVDTVGRGSGEVIQCFEVMET